MRGEARFAVELSLAGQVGAEVSDASGRRVWKLREDAFAPGRHVLRWDGRDASGRPVPSGVYFMRVTSGPRSSVLKLVQAR
jgi:flagellar basal-body rod modification protein FlgD